MSVRLFVLKVFGSVALLTITMAPMAYGNGSGRFSSGCLANDLALQTAEGIQPSQAAATVSVSPAVLWPPNHNFSKVTLSMSLPPGVHSLNSPVSVSLTVVDITDDQVAADDAGDPGCRPTTTIEGLDWAPTDFSGLNTRDALKATSDRLSIHALSLRNERCSQLGTRTYQLSVTCCDITNSVCDSTSEVVNVMAPKSQTQPTIRHYEYVFPDGNIYVYDMDNHFALVKHLTMPTYAGVKGAVASAATGILYISYGSDKLGGSMLAYDLRSDKVLWHRNYSFGIDSMSISPDGKTIYMPTGELASGGVWKVLDARSGNVIASVDSGGTGPHNTVVNSNGTHVYMGPRYSNYLIMARSRDNAVLRQIGPVKNGVRPFVINAKETFAYITTTDFLGFQVADINTGKIIYTVPVQGFKASGGAATCPSHGISLSPDEKEIYLIDSINSYVHVFEVSGGARSTPAQVADIPLHGPLSGDESGCAYDCLKDGWIHHSRNGRYVFVGDSGDVIDTRTRTTVAALPAMVNTRKEIEIDFRNNAPVWAMISR